MLEINSAESIAAIEIYCCYRQAIQRFNPIKPLAMVASYRMVA
jgi:hypothetical protein